jgi:hypothetical protein
MTSLEIYNINQPLWVQRKIKYIFLINDEKELMFYNIPKNASTTLRQLLNKKSHLNERIMDNNIKHYKRYVIIRNPYDRFISGYLARVNRLPKIRYLPFPYFVNEFCKLDKDTMDVHMALQTDMFNVNDSNLTIIRLEDKEKLSHIIKEIFNYDNFLKKNDNPCKEQSLKIKIKEFLKNNKKIQEKIYEYYKKDFDLLKYSKNY